MLESKTYIRIRPCKSPKTAESAALQIVLQMMLLIRVFAGYHVLYDSLNSVQYRLVMTGRQYTIDLRIEQIMSAKTFGKLQIFENRLFSAVASKKTHTTGKTLGKTTVASARYS